MTAAAAQEATDGSRDPRLGHRKLSVSLARERATLPAEPSDEKLANFQNITGLGVDEALQFLEHTKWNVEV